jgi:hypothetical protein
MKRPRTKAGRGLAWGGICFLVVACAAPAAREQTTTPSNQTRKTHKVAAEKKPATAPAPDLWQGRTDLFRAPPIQPVSALRLPKIVRFTLKSGLSVMLVPDDQLP